MNSFSAQLGVFDTIAVLSITGTINNWTRNFGTMEEEQSDLWHIIAAKFPPAEEPPIAHFIMSIWRREMVGGKASQMRTSQESWTAAGYGNSGASLFYDVSMCFLPMLLGGRNIPVFHGYHNTFRSCAEIRTDCILGIDIA